MSPTRRVPQCYISRKCPQVAASGGDFNASGGDSNASENNIPQQINSRDRLSLRICVGVDSVSIDEAVHLGFFLFVARLAGQTIGTGLCSNEGYATCDWNGVRRLDSVVLATCFKIAGEP